MKTKSPLITRMGSNNLDFVFHYKNNVSNLNRCHTSLKGLQTILITQMAGTQNAKVCYNVSRPIIYINNVLVRNPTNVTYTDKYFIIFLALFAQFLTCYLQLIDVIFLITLYLTTNIALSSINRSCLV